MTQITMFQAQTLIQKTQGKIFTAVFVKKDGTTRKMNCRLGVSKHVTGKGMAYDPANRGLVTVFDMQAKEYRMINLSTLTALQISKEFFVVAA